MRFLIVFVALFALATAAPAEEVRILKSNSDVGPDHYSFEVETSDGKSHHEIGELKDVGSEHPVIVVRGEFSYKDEQNGQIYKVTYIADENGFQPQGDHLPDLPKLAL